jgi:hypothetical protein
VKTDLADIRKELGGLVGADLDVVAPALGGKVNAPCVTVAPDTPYLVPLTYESETVAYIVWVVAPPGEGASRLDALDEMIDKVRDALRKPSDKGLMFKFERVDSPNEVDDKLVAGVYVTHERVCC